MKNVLLLLVIMLAVQQLPAQMADDIHGSAVQRGDVSYAPLLLFTNGAGRIFPFDDGQMLEVGRRYFMVAIPDRGFAFRSWQPVNVFTFTEYVRDGSGSIIERTSTVVIPTAGYIKEPVLRFTMEPEQVLFDIPNVRVVTQSRGWQANFVPVRRRIH